MSYLFWNDIDMDQEKQITTLDKNIYSLEIEGTFDDCQRLVKKAFLDQDLNLNVHFYLL